MTRNRRPPRGGSALLALASCLLVAALLADRVGMQLVVVEGGSMSPHLPVGALLLERTEPARDLTVGQVITFRAPTPRGQVVTHRVTAAHVGPDGSLELRTRGDANPGEDPWKAVVEDREVWHVVGSVPHVGTALNVLRRGANDQPLMLLLAAALLLAVWRPRRPNRQRPARRQTGRRTRWPRRVLAVVTGSAMLVLGSGSDADASWTARTASAHAVRSSRFATPALNPATTSCLISRPSVTLTWSVAGDDRTSLVVQRRLASGTTWTTLATVAPTTTSYQDSTAAFSTRYGYRVQGTAGTWTGPSSPEVQITTFPNCL